MPVLPTILLIIDTISSIPLFPFEHKFCHNENCWRETALLMSERCISYMSIKPRTDSKNAPEIAEKPQLDKHSNLLTGLNCS